MADLTVQHIKEFRKDLDALLEDYGKKHSLSFSIGTIRFDTSSFHFVLNAISLQKGQSSEEARPAPYKEELDSIGDMFHVTSVNDAVKSLLNKESIVKHATDIQKASNMSIDLDVEFKKLAKVGLSKGEVTQTKDVITNNRTEDGVQGENTLWKLAQGVGAIARTADPRRKRELEEISGSFFARINE